MSAAIRLMCLLRAAIRLMCLLPLRANCATN